MSLTSNLEITDLSFLFTLRRIRIIRLFRVISVFENSKRLFKGVQHALKSSCLIIFIFVVIDYKYQKQSIEQKEIHFKKELASKDELVGHYKQQSEYQKEQSDRILGQMEKLIEAIRRRDTIEAVEKSVIGKRIDL